MLFLELGLIPAVHGITQYGMPEMAHVHADLVSPARFKLQLEAGESAESLVNGIVSHGAASALLCDRHTLAVCGMTCNRRIDCAPVIAESAYNDGAVFSVHAVILKLGGKSRVSVIVLRYGNESACVHVDPMDDPRTHDSANARQLTLAVVQKCRYKCSVGVARRRMDYHALGLVYHDNIAILVYDVERDILGFSLVGLRLRKLYHEHLSCRHSPLFLNGFPLTRLGLDPYCSC